jgi:glucose/arabinose dehydrogenase
MPTVSWMKPVILCAALVSTSAKGVDLRFNDVSDATQVVDIRNAGDGSGRLFLVRQNGKVMVLSEDRQQETEFLDISDRVLFGGERGLLSIAFAPDYAESGHFYAWYTGAGGSMVLAAFSVSGNPGVADPDSERTILNVQQPASNHNGGRLAFGPDGFLYLSIGDGGGSGDPQNNGQNANSLLGTVIRISPDPVAGGYSVPASNPFVGQPGVKQEIWAYGLRNPWRISFDRATGDLYIADVGQGEWEEVNVQSALSAGGHNYGWNVMEGTHCFLDDGCDMEGLTLPVTEYSHGQGCSITGGEVYRGNAYPDLQGRYLYGDFCSGRIWGLRRSGSNWNNELLAQSPLNITTFGEDETGAVYVADPSRGVFLISDGPLVVEPDFVINAGINDSWFNTATTGQGFFIIVFPKIKKIFLAWFTYDSVRPASSVSAIFGEPGHRWITAFGDYDGDEAVLEIELTQGGRLDQQQPMPAQTPYGTMVLKFTGCNAGIVLYEIPGTGLVGEVSISRLAPDNIALCEALSQ